MTAAQPAKKHKFGKDRFELMDWILIIVLTVWMLCILIPFFNVIAISFTSYKEYMQSTWVIWPKEPVLDAYQELFKDNRIFVGYKTTICYLIVGVPFNLVLCCTLAYALCRKGWPGRRLLFMLILFTMIFNGGIVPLYLVMKDLGLTNTIWSVILAQGMNTFNMILIYNYFCSLPEALMESANLDGADEWTILFRDCPPALQTDSRDRRFVCRGPVVERILPVDDLPSLQQLAVAPAGPPLDRYGLAGGRHRFDNGRISANRTLPTQSRWRRLSRQWSPSCASIPSFRNTSPKAS